MYIYFAGEKIPLQSPDLRERLDRELLVNTYWQSNMMLLIKRANKYFPTIEKILAEEGVPTDLKYLSVIESGLENVISPMGAKGFWQIMRTTGREYGLEVNSNVDERYHLEFSTRMAAKYLKKARDKFVSWTLAASSYNLGVSGIQRNLNMQKVESYFDLRLGQETSRYVFRVLAVKEIIENPPKYGYMFEESDLFSSYSFDENYDIVNGINYYWTKVIPSGSNQDSYAFRMMWYGSYLTAGYTYYDGYNNIPVFKNKKMYSDSSSYFNYASITEYGYYPKTGHGIELSIPYGQMNFKFDFLFKYEKIKSPT